MITPRQVRRHLDQLTKPPGSLGRLEDLGARLCLLQNTLEPAVRPRRLVIFAGDHGVVAEGVTAWPAEVTALMIGNILDGGAASSVLARATGTELVVVDAGSRAAPLPPRTGYRDARVRAGSRNLAHEPALTPEEWDRATALGREEAEKARHDGVRVLAAGEMGIGNSTPAACLASLLLDLPAERVTGRGAGADDAVLARKLAVVAAAVEPARDVLAYDARRAIAAVAGCEIAAMAGLFAASHRLGLTVVLDGFIASAAALAAERLHPGTAGSLVAAHHSAEIGHRAVLAALGLEPLLDWGMRLGEGTGALLVMPLLDAAATVVGEMATFRDLGIERD